MEINTEKYYTLQEVYKFNILKWFKSYSTLKRWVKKDIEKHDNKLFKVIKHGKGVGTRYLIKGETLLEIIKKVENGYIFNGNNHDEQNK